MDFVALAVFLGSACASFPWFLRPSFRLWALSQMPPSGRWNSWSGALSCRDGGCPLVSSCPSLSGGCGGSLPFSWVCMFSTGLPPDLHTTAGARRVLFSFTPDGPEAFQPLLGAVGGISGLSFPTAEMNEATPIRPLTGASYWQSLGCHSPLCWCFPCCIPSPAPVALEILADRAPRVATLDIPG